MFQLRDCHVIKNMKFKDDSSLNRLQFNQVSFTWVVLSLLVLIVEISKIDVTSVQ